MAYVGEWGQFDRTKVNGYYTATCTEGSWSSSYPTGMPQATKPFSEPFLEIHYAIDVRTEWAQEHFPIHCRIRNYQEPDPFNEWIEREFHKEFNPSCTYMMIGEDLKELYELNSK